MKLSLQPPAANPTTEEGGSGGLDLWELLLALWRHKFAILGLALFGALAAFYYATTLPPVYRASLTLLIEQPRAPLLPGQEFEPRYYDWEYRETQYQLLRSRRLAERVVKALELHRDPRFAPAARPQEKARGEAGGIRRWFEFFRPARYAQPAAPSAEKKDSTPQRITALAAMVSGGLAVDPIPDSHLVVLSYSSTDPELAARIVNAVAEQYIESQLDANLESTLQATQWLSARLADLRENLRRAEERLQAYRERERLVDVKGIATLSAERLSDLARKHAEARERRQQLELLMREVAEARGSPPERLLRIPAVQQHPLVADRLEKVAEAERKVAELGKRYGVKHPRMIAAQQELAVARRQLEEELEKVIQGMESEYQLALEAERELARQVEEARREVQEINRKEFEVQALEREVETNRQLYELFFTRLKQTDQLKGFEAASARIVDPALVPRAPVSPNKRLITLGGGVVGLFSGVALALLLAFLDNTVRTPEEVETKLRAPLLGVLPEQKPDRDGYLELYWENPRTPFAEHIRTLRTALVLAGLDQPLKVIVVTSSLPGEGKSVISLDLGAAFAQLEKTLVIGADMRRPTLASKCRFSPRHPGLSNYLAGSATLEECLVKIGEGEFYVMPSGLIPPNPLEMLSSARFRKVMEELAERFDRILVDSAPLQAVSDALILATYADTLVYVVCADQTPATVARRGIERIRATTVPFAGVVLNRFDVAKASRYYGGEAAYAGYYQGSDAPERPS
ncbi:MAG: chain-length determining protein [Porticoccaceae bacterium]|nr:MAG: chain-length determining protein [Porticoccaceae bacterium]